MDVEPITALNVLSWLADQCLVYASHPAYGVRLKLIYWPSSRKWEVTLGASDVHYTGEDVNRAVEKFNEILGVPLAATQKEGQ